MSRMRCGRDLKQAFLVLPALVLTMVALLGCGPQQTSLAPPGSQVSTGTTTTTVSAAPANPFAAAALAEGSALPTDEPTVVIETGDESWVLPAAVSMRTAADADIVLAAAKQQAATVYQLVEPLLIRGWPSTAPWRDLNPAEERDLRVAGVTALTLASLVGQQAALEQAWVDYEHDFAYSPAGYAPSWISSRAAGWKTVAQALTQALAERFPAGTAATSLGATADTSTPAVSCTTPPPGRFQWGEWLHPAASPATPYLYSGQMETATRPTSQRFSICPCTRTCTSQWTAARRGGRRVPV